MLEAKVVSNYLTNKNVHLRTSISSNFVIFRTKNGEELEDYHDQTLLTIEKIDDSSIATYACNISNDFGYVYKVL